MKKLTLKLLIIGGILSIIGVVIGIGGFAMMGFDVEAFAITEVGPPIEKTYATKETPISKIEVQVKEKNIELKPTNKDEIKILGEGNVCNFNVSSEGVLSITEEERQIKGDRWYRLMNWDNLSKQNLILEIPKSFRGDIALNSDYSQIIANDLGLINSLSCASKESHIEFNHLEIKNNLKLILNYGAIKLSSIKTGKGSVIENKEGNLEIKDSVLEDLSINKNYGGVNLKNLTGNALNLLSKESKFSFENIAIKEINMETYYGNIDFSELSSDLIKLKTSEGHINGSIKGKMSDYKISALSKEGKSNLETKLNGNKELYVEALGRIDIRFSEN